MKLAFGLLPLSVITVATTFTTSEEPSVSTPVEPALVVAAPVAEAPAVATPVASSPSSSLLAPQFFGFDECCRVSDSITSNFNGTKIPAGSYLWLNAVVDITGITDTTTIVRLCDGDVVCNIGGADYYVELPQARIVVSDLVNTATTDFDCDKRIWTTLVPKGYTGNVFLTGALLSIKKGLPGGLNPVTWNVTFCSDHCGLSFQWKWAAAVYDCGTDCEDGLGVKPVDGDKFSQFLNSDHAGTPEYIKDCVIGGARGGGGSNYTGSYSGTSTAKCE